MFQPTRSAPASDALDDLVLIGPIVRFQVQTASLKQGERPRSWYDPSPIRSVPVLHIDRGGVTGFDGAPVADVHHRDHPRSRYRGENGVSIGLTGHYMRMRERHGTHLVDGIAGENILIQASQIMPEGEIGHAVVILTANGPVELTTVIAAPPCVEFSRFCAGYGPDQKSDRIITETLQFLDHGMRAFYATLTSHSPSPVAITIGDRVYRRRG